MTDVAVTSSAAAPAPNEPIASQTKPVEPTRRDSQALWTLVVGAPALLSVLRLWVEAGGELQTTLLLVENVAPINLVAAFIAVGMGLVTAGLVMILAIGGVLAASARHSRTTPPLFARWATTAPNWLKGAAFVFAALTWQIRYLPLLALAVCAALQLSPFRGRHLLTSLFITALTLAGFGFALAPTIGDAAASHEWIVLLLLTAPPVLALGVAGPILSSAIRPIGVLAQLAGVMFLAWASIPFFTTPVLPLTVAVVDGGETPGYIRGHIVTRDDMTTIILQEHGGVRFVDSKTITSLALCPTEEELPRYRLWVHDFYIEDSILRAVGRHIRPAAQVSPACRVPARG